MESNYGESMVLTLSDNSKVWAPESLKDKIKQCESEQLPYYVRPLGFKPSKNNKKNKYHAFDFAY
jgi:hypothetical protein